MNKNERPYVFCHMLTSLDGKIMGNYMETAESDKAGAVFYDIAFGKEPFYKHQGWLSGRTTTDDNFTLYREPALKKGAPKVPDGDFITNVGKKTYYVSVDPRGRLGWTDNKLTYEDTEAWVIEALTEKADNDYKAFLRELGIPYIVAGRDKLDYAYLLKTLKDVFGITTLMLGGGGVLNWSFIQAGMCDEISVVIAAAADGSPVTQTLFMAKDGLSDDKPVGFELISAEVKDGGSLWLRYKVK